MLAGLTDSELCSRSKNLRHSTGVAGRNVGIFHPQRSSGRPLPFSLHNSIGHILQSYISDKERLELIRQGGSVQEKRRME